MNLRRVHITILKCPQGHFSTRATIRILRANEEYRKLSAPKNLISFILIQGSKLTLANSQNASDFDNLRVRKISTSKRLRVRIIHVSQTKGNNLLVVSPVCQRKKILVPKLCKCTKKITSSPVNCSTLSSLRTPVRAALLTILSQHYSSSLQLSLGKLKSITLGFLAISSSCFHRLLSLAEDCFGLSDICSIGNICVGSLTARN